MRISSFVTNGFYEAEVYEKLIARIKAEGADEVEAICLSREYYKGFPIEQMQSFEERVQKLKAAGASKVVCFPKENDLLDEDSRILAVSTFFLKQKEIDELILPFEGELEMVNRISYFLLRVPAEYTNKVKELRKKGEVIMDHSPALMEQYVPGAEAFLAYPNNLWNMKLYQNLVSFYSPVKMTCINYTLPEDVQPCISADMEIALGRQISKRVMGEEEYLRKTRLTDIMYGMERRTDKLLSAVQEELSFSELAEKIAEPEFPLEKARCYLLMVLYGFRKIDNTVLSLNGYVEHIEKL